MMLIFLFFDILRFAEAPDSPKSLKNTDDDSGSSFEELGIVFLSCDEGTSAKNVESEDPKSQDGKKQQKSKEERKFNKKQTKSRNKVGEDSKTLEKIIKKQRPKPPLTEENHLLKQECVLFSSDSSSSSMCLDEFVCIEISSSSFYEESRKFTESFETWCDWSGSGTVLVRKKDECDDENEK